MDYSKQYTKLINRALTRVPALHANLHYEKHHILPISMGGRDIVGNLAFLTPKEHYIAHLLLWAMGNHNQIFSVKCFLDDSINIRSHRFGMFRWKKWLRRKVAFQHAKNLRDNARVELANNYNTRVQNMTRAYEKTVMEIENEYAKHLTTLILDDAFENAT